ncbi:protein of unknown function [Pararobbsia alpina]
MESGVFPGSMCESKKPQALRLRLFLCPDLLQILICRVVATLWKRAASADSGAGGYGACLHPTILPEFELLKPARLRIEDFSSRGRPRA